MSDYTVLHVRKLADRSEGERVVRFDPVTGERKLVNPDTPGDDHEPWPLAGVEIVGEVPERTTVSTRWLDTAVDEGWARREGERLVRRPAGPPTRRWAVDPHTFVHADEVVLSTVDGEVRYRVTHQPDKYVADGDDDTPMTPEHYAAGNSRVDHFYGLERVA